MFLVTMIVTGCVTDRLFLQFVTAAVVRNKLLLPVLIIIDKNMISRLYSFYCEIFDVLQRIQVCSKMMFSTAGIEDEARWCQCCQW
jgi:ABC-type enterochelin transport system permease subunit